LTQTEVAIPSSLEFPKPNHAYGVDPRRPEY